MLATSEGSLFPSQLELIKAGLDVKVEKYVNLLKSTYKPINQIAAFIK